MSNRYCMLSSYCSHQTENYNTTAINTGNSLWPFIFFSLQAVDIKTSLFRMGRQLWWISAETGVTAIIWKARWDCYYLYCHHITPICTDIFFVSPFYHDISVLFYRLFCRWSVNSIAARCIWLHWLYEGYMNLNGKLFDFTPWNLTENIRIFYKELFNAFQRSCTIHIFSCKWITQIK